MNRCWTETRIAQGALYQVPDRPVAVAEDETHIEPQIEVREPREDER